MWDVGRGREGVEGGSDGKEWAEKERVVEGGGLLYLLSHRTQSTRYITRIQSYTHRPNTSTE